MKRSKCSLFKGLKVMYIIYMYLLSIVIYSNQEATDVVYIMS